MVVQGIVDDRKTIRMITDSGVCANYPLLQRMYAKAAKNNLTQVMERLAIVCQRLDTIKTR